jgi:hypothetical protein
VTISMGIYTMRRTEKDDFSLLIENPFGKEALYTDED